MRAEFKWKFGLVVVLALIALVILYPPLSVKVLSAFGIETKGPYNGQPIRQGLDLRGGMEIILGPDYRVEDGVLQQVQTTISQQVKQVQTVSAPTISLLGLADMGKHSGLKLTFATEEEARRVMAAGVIEEELTLPQGGGRMHLLLKPERLGAVVEITVEQSPQDFPDDALARARTILEDRVNRLGLSEPDIRLDEEKQRIVVQLPSVTTEKEAKDILQRTGRLNFRIDGRKVMFGDDLKSAHAGYDHEGRVAIFFAFDTAGARTFAQITAQNVNKQMGMYLDEDLLMEPVIEEPITNGEGVIRMGKSTMAEAKKYAVLMEAGSLPISLRNLAVNQVAPTLGKEMIRQSLTGALIGLALVGLFMIIFYGLVGVLADFALVIYAALVLLVLALLRGVLTLPGVAGFILSIGMAVDANIIIFERIKDELRTGKSMRPALAAGFKRAFTTIIDSNVTTFIIAFVLLIYGTGPVRGFAVTLGIGIVVSMFTALVVTRLFVEMLIDRAPDKFAGYFRS